MANNTTFLVYGTLSPSIYTSLSVFLIILAIVAIFLNTMLWLYLKDATTPSAIFIRVILFVLLPAILVGFPLQFLVFMDSFKSFIDCQRSLVTSTICLLSSWLMALWQLAGMAFQRYCFIIRKDHFFIVSKTKHWICMLLVLGFTLSAYIAYERFWNPFPLSYCFINYQIPVRQCSSPNNCTRYMVFVIISFTEITCSIIILYSTLKLKKHIEDHENKTSALLGSRRRTNSDRLQATHYLWIGYMILSIPLGLTRILFTIFSNPVIAVTLSDTFHTFGNISFLVVSLVYIKMDSSYSNLLQTKLQSVKQVFGSNRVNPEIELS